MRTLLLVTVPLLLAAVAMPQGAGTKPPAPPTPAAKPTPVPAPTKPTPVKPGDQLLQKRIKNRVREMRRAITEGLPITTSVRVTAQLRNGHKIRGVVKNGRFIEKFDRLDFVPAEVKTPGAGIRVWYYNNTNSYIFLPFEALKSYRIGARLTSVQIQEIEKRIASSQADAKQARVAALARRQRVEEEARRKRAAAGGATESDKAAAAAETAKDEAALAKLLVEFPPEDGWGEAKLREIQTAKITIGSYPDAKAQRFLEVFAEWQRAFQMRETKQSEERKVGSESGGEKTGEKTEEKPAVPPGKS